MWLMAAVAWLIWHVLCDGIMKILFVGDYSNYNRTLGEALVAMGHDVTIASNGGGWMRTRRDVDLSRPVAGRAGGALLYVKLRWLLNSRMSGYDVVHINNPLFVDLRPERVYDIFRRLVRGNGAVFLTAMGTDSFYVDMCMAADAPLRYSEWRIGEALSPMALARHELLRQWLDPAMMDHCRRIYDEVKGGVSVLYEYHCALQRYMPDKPMAYVGIPVDTASVTRTVSTSEVPERVNLFLGRHATRVLEKGTDRLEQVARTLVDRYPDRCRLILVENRPYAEYVQLLSQGHVMLDQVYSYTPATNALLGMARGMCAVSGAEPEYYGFIGAEQPCQGLINATPGDDGQLLAGLEQLVVNPERIPGQAVLNREFVMRHNDSEVVARRYVRFWESVL